MDVWNLPNSHSFQKGKPMPSEQPCEHDWSPDGYDTRDQAEVYKCRKCRAVGHQYATGGPIVPTGLYVPEVADTT